MKRTVLFSLLVGVLCVGAPCGRADAAEREFRTWTSTSGSTVQAQLIFNYGASVVLAKEDGSRLTIRVAYLSEEDKTYLRGSSQSLVRQPVRSEPEKDKLDINRATQDELKFLPKIGDALAIRIIDGRPYEKTSDLLRIPGMGEKTFAAISEEICVRPMEKRKRGIKR